VEAVRVIAARGSGDPEEGSPGPILTPFIKQLENQANPGAVNGEGLDYPAVAVIPSKLTLGVSALGGPGVAEVVLAKKLLDYKHSVDAGVTNLVKVVKARAARCPDVKLVLAGYSQGAHVVRDALNRLGPLASHIGAVALFGDPHFDPGSKAAVKGGTFEHRRYGLLGKVADFPAAFRSHLATYCLRDDVVCQRYGGTAAHKRYAPQFTNQAALKVAAWLGLRRSRTCTPAQNVATIIDDSGSMSENDPLDIRAAAMQLLLTEPTGQGRTIGAVEFGDEAGPLFLPAKVGSDQASMLASLGELQDDGYDDTGSDTNYNAAFAASAAEQPGADARIFLTDGEHNVGPYENGHVGGPRTYVIGLNIGPAGQGSEAADLLGRIASETGGVYYPLRQQPDDDALVQSQRLQPVFNAINAELECQIAPSQATRSLTQPGVQSKPVKGSFYGNVGEQIVVSWTTPGTAVAISGVTVLNPGGGVVANLNGKRAHGSARHKHSVRALEATTVSANTFQSMTVTRPPHGSMIKVRVTAESLSAPTSVTVQLSPVESLPALAPPAVTLPPAGSSTAGAVPTTPSPGSTGEAPTPAPPAPANHLEQETPNHPVNTFTNYHNASGMGPAIAAGQWVEVSCRVYDPTIASVNPDGWWYRIASSPWSNAYYSPANTFMNGDPYGGPYTHNTDFSVPVC
jgi:Mg-chelatase subunit ChlD